MLPDNPKLRSLESMQEIRSRIRKQSETLVMTNGCFDLLHTGHICFLQAAQRLGDRLLVALNSDASVRTLKGPQRPIQSELERAFALAALACVDHIVVFRGVDLAAEIAALEPDVYVKAGDYNLERLHPEERATLERVGAKICFTPFHQGFSTSNLIKKINQAGGIS